MLKLLIGLVGLVEALYPDRFISTLTDFSYEYDGEAPTAKPWVVTAARIEGLILLGVAIRAAIKTDRATADEPSTADATPAESSDTVDRI
ncbi:hypothetical protein [Halohasta litorea]|uniref:Uncharacterized protein n=1 Tax=Halohasta litorea TaxID=869891 RepID=A0ABD6D3L0_9EURY|nr:hypothetical protein [Halohasta litorea]